MKWQRKDLLGLQDLSAEEIMLILNTAGPMKEILSRPIKKVPVLRGKTIVTMFYEPSTRTRTSFELAGKYLSADTVNLAMSTSSVQKGESLKDTALTIEAMKADVLIMRHEATGAPHFMSRIVNSRVINAGDGMHEHPTQALLDLFTIQEKKGKIEGLTVAILGDILHSRVARSNIWGLTKLGAKVRVVGPSTLLPDYFKKMGVEIYHSVEEAVKDVDVINVLRLQRERQKKGLLPSLREYSRLFCLTPERLQLAKPDALVLHPGPMNRGVEIASEVADGLQAAINEQVTNGVAVRMAILYLLMGGSTDDVAA
ncbi:MAG TPA: aspartate carbamoyltransferase catalytic subunit [Clostridia bacterium]|nr:aspartate carbamoyltransferase catalytic subunit [Clostridia bacterium]